MIKFIISLCFCLVVSVSYTQESAINIDFSNAILLSHNTEDSLSSETKITAKQLYNGMREYVYYLPPLADVPHAHNTIRFIYKDFEDFDARARQDSTIVHKVSTRECSNIESEFNKENILTLQQFDNTERNELIGHLRSRDRFYLIDNTNDGNTVLRQVYYVYAGEE